MENKNNEKPRDLDEPESRPEMPEIPNVEKIYSENPYLERYIQLVEKALNEDSFKLENVSRTVEECNKVIFKDNFIGTYLELESIQCKHGKLRRFYFPESNSIQLSYSVKS